MSITIWRYKVDKGRKILELSTDGIEHAQVARVTLIGWDHKSEVRVSYTSQDSDEWIVCQAAVKSSILWKWPWWKFSANRKLAYLKKNKSPQLFLERESLDEGMEGM